jgi:hypothetical protein
MIEVLTAIGLLIPCICELLKQIGDTYERIENARHKVEK